MIVYYTRSISVAYTLLLYKLYYFITGIINRISYVCPQGWSTMEPLYGFLPSNSIRSFTCKSVTRKLHCSLTSLCADAISIIHRRGVRFYTWCSISYSLKRDTPLHTSLHTYTHLSTHTSLHTYTHCVARVTHSIIFNIEMYNKVYVLYAIRGIPIT